MEITEGLHAFIWTNPTANNCNTYLIDGKKRILVDPGHNHLLSHVRENLSWLGLSVEDIDLILITHGHPDHIEGIRPFLDSGTLITISRIELDFIKDIAPQYGESLGISPSGFDFLLQEGDLRIGDMVFQVINTPGHSPGSVCLYWPDRKALFTGDVVFHQGIGRVDLPAGDGHQLKESIKRISKLDVEYLLPGHGNIISGKDNVKSNFKVIEQVWFGYI